MNAAPDPRVIVALDFSDEKSAFDLATQLDPQLCRLKIGKELFTAAGPALVETLMRPGFSVFLDLKYHDIPNTVASACRAARDLGVWMVNLHALGGRAMMEAARAAVDGPKAPKLVAVTVLTSMSAADLAAVGVRGTPEEAVLRLASLAQSCGLDGVVCSAQETPALRAQCARDFCLVTPGIRPAESAADDQQRIMTPAEAIRAGSDYLVIGRPITRAPNPLAALERINQEVAASSAAAIAR